MSLGPTGIGNRTNWLPAGDTDDELRLRMVPGGGGGAPAPDPPPPPPDEDLPPVTHYAAPTAQGTGDGSSPANAFTVASFIALPPQPGDHLQLASGTMASPTVYTGANSQINPNGISGTQTDRIIVSCEVDGGVLLDGQFARDMVDLRDCHWWVLQGFNIRESKGRGGAFRDGSSNNVFRRLISWDIPSDATGTQLSVGNGVNNPCFDNLIEDCAGFGEGQTVFSSSQGAQGTTMRRIWLQGHVWKGLQFSYQCHDNLMENVIGTWQALGVQRESEIASRGTHCVGRIDKGIAGAPVNKISNSKLLGCIAYIPSEAGIGELAQLIDVMNEQGGLTFRDILLHSEKTLKNGKLTRLRNLDEPDPASVYENVTEILGPGNVAETAGTGWTVSNRVSVATAGEAPSPWGYAGSGARVAFRYVDEQLTNVPLWPWPMDARIRAALSTSGRNPDVIFRGAGNGVTEMMEDLFGAIPAEFRSD
jgi:hypothetical protein